ncbi:hypothetical protein [Pseudomonas sp. C9-3]|uniref:hypothetical protein n=1 Tax=Pseudomonas sp. C9-3 TaxID=3078264 RepID=UPI0028ED4160|nr:hypothetical protein [Pseudomonas sp. C9-3]
MGLPPDCDQLRTEVFRLLGKMIVNLQNYERMLKTLVSSSNVHFLPDHPGDPFEPSRSRVSKMTLGMLAREFTTGTMATNDALDEEPPEVHFGFRFRIQSEGPILEMLDQDIRQLVQIRNDLAHHFTAMFDLSTTAGCELAIAHFEENTPFVHEQYQSMHSWLSVLQVATAELYGWLGR